MSMGQNESSMCGGRDQSLSIYIDYGKRSTRPALVLFILMSKMIKKDPIPIKVSGLFK